MLLHIDCRFYDVDNKTIWDYWRNLMTTKSNFLLTFFPKFRRALNLICYSKMCYTLMILVFSVSCFIRRSSVKQLNPLHKYFKTPLDLFLFCFFVQCLRQFSTYPLPLISERNLRVKYLYPYHISWNNFSEK